MEGGLRTCIERHLISTRFNARQGTYADNRSAVISRLFTQEHAVTLGDEACSSITWARLETRVSRIDRSTEAVQCRQAISIQGRGGTRRQTPWSPKPGTKGGEGREGYELYMNEAKKNETLNSPFVSELGAALLGWSRGYLGFPPHGGRHNRGRRLIVNVILLNNFGLAFIEEPD